MTCRRSAGEGLSDRVVRIVLPEIEEQGDACRCVGQPCARTGTARPFRGHAVREGRDILLGAGSHAWDRREARRSSGEPRRAAPLSSFRPLGNDLSQGGEETPCVKCP